MEKEKQFPKRNAILNFLRESKQHPSAEAVYDRLKQDYPDLSLGTVYRNLSLFKREGLIISLGTVNGVERFDANTRPHVHFVCTCCGKVADLTEIKTPEILEKAQRVCPKAEVDGYQLTFTGICPECLEKQQEGGEIA